MLFATLLLLGTSSLPEESLSLHLRKPLRRLATPHEVCSGKADGASCTFDTKEGQKKTDTCQNGVCGTPPGGGAPGGGAPGGGAPGGGAPGGGAPAEGGSVACASPPCAAALLGDVAFTTVSGTDPAGATFTPGENIYGPFEAGFGAQQNSNLESLGCSDGNLGHVAGGIDTATAEQIVAFKCSITLPRREGSSYISLLDECGGHTKEYHFHERLSCLYKEEGGHSTKVGETPDKVPIYGKWEDYSTKTLPVLDACGGQFGVTPDSGGKEIYHYQVQDKPPFTIGCYGPAKNAVTGAEELVSLATCRALYDECGNGDVVTLTTKTGSVEYDPFCPCFDKAGSNVPAAGADLGTLQKIEAPIVSLANSGKSISTGGSSFVVIMAAAVLALNLQH